ncbi:MAG: hypothetical protein U0835_07925 [Isosphaeraceae bacterium]
MVAEPSPRPRPDPSPDGPEKGAPADSASARESNPYANRMFLHEPGWRIALKVGSERVFCYQMAPGQDYYHRLLDGEVYVFNADERLCLACAERRGLLTHEPKGLKPPPTILVLESDPNDPTGFDVKGLDELFDD